MSTSKRRQFTPDEKAAIIREHLVEKVEVLALCEKHGIQPSLFYLWRNQLFENLAAPCGIVGPLGTPQQRAVDAERNKVAQLEARLAQKDQRHRSAGRENIALKKDGGSEGPMGPPRYARRGCRHHHTVALLTGLAVRLVLGWAGLQPGRFYDWKRRYQERANEHTTTTSRGTTGSKPGSVRPSSTSTTPTHSMGIAASPT
ncbi:MAG: transposase [bacterium]